MGDQLLKAIRAASAAKNTRAMRLRYTPTNALTMALIMMIPFVGVVIIYHVILAKKKTRSLVRAPSYESLDGDQVSHELDSLADDVEVIGSSRNAVVNATHG